MIKMVIRMKKLTIMVGLLYLTGLTGLTAQEAEVIEAEIIEDEEVVNVPFAIINEVPIFPGCENNETVDRRSCFSQQLQKHISTHFRYPEEAKKQDIQGRVSVMFTIDAKGNIISIKTRGNPILEEEARRIIELLPKMEPGKHHNRPVSVPFSIPISFSM